MRALLAAVCALVVYGCSPEYADAHQVEGQWVSNASVGVETCTIPNCPAFIEQASEAVLSRSPGRTIKDARLHSLPTVRSDETTMAVTIDTYLLVFTLDDGSERIEWFACARGSAAGGSPAYARFCQGGASRAHVTLADAD